MKTIYPDDIPISIEREARKVKGEIVVDQYRIVKPNGEIRWVEDRGIPLSEEESGKQLYIGIIIDVTETKKAEYEMIHSVYHDDLTGLPNRKYFNEHLNDAIAKATTDDFSLAVMFIDLDQFKMVNDTLGHSVGDQLLKQVATRIQSCVHKGDIVARQSGDEFIILFKQNLEDKIEVIAKKILFSLKSPFILGGRELIITPSIGISVFPDHGYDGETLIKNADAAMYEVKANGKNHCRVFSSEIGKTNNRKMRFIQDLRKGIEEHEFEVYYQPKIDLTTGKVGGVEALLRWNHPYYGLVSPLEFIPIAEETGLIIPLGEWVLRTACIQYMQWVGMAIAPDNICINLSTRQFMDEHFNDKVAKIMEKYDFNPQNLALEITESVAIYNMEEAVAKLAELRGLGIKLALDDFGTGYCSLNYLRRFPIDELKIDRSFINDLLKSSENQVIVRAIISVAHSLNMKVIAEGVEQLEQLQFLHYENCDFAQGFYFSRPVPLAEIEMILRKGTMNELIDEG